MVQVNSTVTTYGSSPANISHEIQLQDSMLPCAVFATGLGTGDTLKLQMFVGTDYADRATDSLWVTVRSGASDVGFTTDDNQYQIECPGLYRLKNTATLTATTTAVVGVLRFG
jgi:hypothetical protein